MAFGFNKVPDVLLSSQSHIYFITQYIVKIWWEIFPTVNATKCDATVASFVNSADYY